MSDMSIRTYRTNMWALFLQRRRKARDSHHAAIITGTVILSEYYICLHKDDTLVTTLQLLQEQ